MKSFTNNFYVFTPEMAGWIFAFVIMEAYLFTAFGTVAVGLTWAISYPVDSYLMIFVKGGVTGLSLGCLQAVFTVAAKRIEDWLDK